MEGVEDLFSSVIERLSKAQGPGFCPQFLGGGAGRGGERKRKWSNEAGEMSQWLVQWLFFLRS